MKFKVTAFALILALTGSQSWADGDTDAESTIRLMGNAEAALPDAVTKEITLPAHLLGEDTEDQKTAVKKAEKGLAKANEREARERGAEMSEKAKGKREERGRSESHPTPPEKPNN